jgi:plasmid stabilization system protein ParE
MENGYDIAWDENALRAIRKIYNYLKKNVSEATASRFRSDVFDSIDALITQPERYGFDRILWEDPPRYRSIPIGGYRVVYEFKTEVIYILLVYHSRQNPEKIKKEMP